MLPQPPDCGVTPMLEVIANALRSPSARIIEECCGYYRNSKDEWGCYVTVREAGHYHMISVSHLTEFPTVGDIADALVSPFAQVKEDGRYPNRKGTLGYYATVRSGEHWYMVSVSDIVQPYHKQWWADRVR